MNEVFEKIIDKLEEQKAKGIYDYNSIIGEKNVWAKAIEIVKQEAEQYTSTEHINCSSDSSTNCWIPCSERLPEKTNHYLVTTDNHTIPMYAWWKISEKRWFYFNSTVEMFDVIAWQPLPEPYQPKGE